MKFATGMSFKEVAQTAPETVRGSIYFKVDDFKKFLDENKDEKGWVHTKMMKSKEKGTIYFILDTWKPTPTAETTKETQDYNDTKYQLVENAVLQSRTPTVSHATGRTSPTEEHPDGLPLEDIGF